MRTSLATTLFLSVAIAVLTADSSTALAAHPYFLAATIDDPKTIASVCQSQKNIQNVMPAGTVSPHAPQDLHVSLVVFGDTLSKSQKTTLHTIIAGVVSGLDKYGPIKLATAIKGGDFAVFTGFIVYALEKPGILATIARASRSAVEKAVKSGKTDIFVDPRDDFGSKPNAHISFGTFDPNGKIGGQKTSTVLKKTFISFSRRAEADKGQVIIDPPNATKDWVLYEIDLKHNEGGHYVNVDSWVLPNPGMPHPKPPPCPP